MSSARILVVDDEADIRGLVSEILSEEGYEVEVAADAAQARALRARRRQRERGTSTAGAIFPGVDPARYLDARC